MVMHARYGTQEVIVGIEACGRFAFGAFDFRALQLWRDRADNACGDAVLKVENILERTVKPIRPQMHAVRHIDQLPSDAYAITGLAHAAFKHIAHAELTSDLLDADGLALVGEARIARDDEEPADT